MNISKSKIEYLTHCWNFQRGCLNPLSVCPTMGTCWARSLADRFNKGVFAPSFKIGVLVAGFPMKPARIGVCYTGDLFGPWVDSGIIEKAKTRVWSHPEHTFLFLTKNPQRYAEFNPWPDNAWVGCSITGAETQERQMEMANYLLNADAKIRWISYEPMLGELQLRRSLKSLQWLVIGAQSGPGAVKPPLEWATDVIETAEMMGHPIWIKKNLLKSLPYLNLRQELPKRLERL